MNSKTRQITFASIALLGLIFLTAVLLLGTEGKNSPKEVWSLHIIMENGENKIFKMGSKRDCSIGWIEYKRSTSENSRNSAICLSSKHGG